MNILGDHFGPILYLLSPIYKLFPYPHTLLIIQAFFVSLSGIFIYLIAIDKLKSRFQSTLLTISYLTAPGILSAVNFDFHLATISVLPLSLILYAWYFNSWKLYYLSLFFSILFKEDIPIFIFGLGLFSLFKKQIKIGLFTIIFALVSYYLIKYQIMPYLFKGAEDSYINSFSVPVNDPLKLLFFFSQPSEILNIFSDSSTKTRTLVTLYGQFFFLPILSFLNWLTVLPYLFLRFSSNQTHYWGTFFHYNANLIPFLVVSTIFVLPKIKFPKYLINTLLILSILASNLYLNQTVLDTFQLDYINIKNYNYINKTLKTIPKESAVSAQSPLVPHLSNRNKIYMYPEVLDSDFIILDQNLGYYPMNIAEFKDKISSLTNSTEWVLENKENTLYIFKRKTIR